MKLITLYLCVFGCLINQPCFPQLFEDGSIPSVVKNDQTLNYPWSGGFGAPLVHISDSRIWVWEMEGNFYQIWEGDLPNSATFTPSTANHLLNIKDADWVRFHETENQLIALISLNGTLRYSVYNLSSFTLDVDNEVLQAEFPTIGGETIRTFIPTLPLNIPLLMDREQDGDLDICTFNANSQGVDFYENNSGQWDQFDLVRVSECWGKMEEDFGVNAVILNRPCNNKSIKSGMHAGGNIGGYSVGDTSYLYVGSLLHNNINAIFVDQQFTPKEDSAFFEREHFPSKAPINVDKFPGFSPNTAGNYAALSPNGIGISSTINPVQLFKNTGGKWANIDSNFLQNQHIDIGFGAYPSKVDWNGDGLEDFFVSGGKRVNNLSSASYELYLSTNGKLEFLDVAIPTVDAIKEAVNIDFGDVSRDGIPDMLLGLENGGLRYALGTRSGQNLVFGKLEKLPLDREDSIRVAGKTVARWLDFNSDGLLDILVSTPQRMQLFLHNGFDFSEDQHMSDSLTELAKSAFFTDPVQFGIRENEIWGSQPQIHRIYPVQLGSNSISGLENTAHNGSLLFCENTVFIGTPAGGVQASEFSLTPSPRLWGNLYPNPNKNGDFLFVGGLEGPFNYRVINLQGQIIRERKSEGVIQEFLYPGVYFIQIHQGGNSKSFKWIVE
ncbi:MAG: hypothetical protein ACJAY8_000205 [Sphingobacteriales bacterium]|jgi:hypothetical protein